MFYVAFGCGWLQFFGCALRRTLCFDVRVHYACVPHQITVVHYIFLLLLFFKRRLYLIRIYYALYFRFSRIFR